MPDMVTSDLPASDAGEAPATKRRTRKAADLPASDTGDASAKKRRTRKAGEESEPRRSRKPSPPSCESGGVDADSTTSGGGEAVDDTVSPPASAPAAGDGHDSAGDAAPEGPREPALAAQEMASGVPQPVELGGAMEPSAASESLRETESPARPHAEERPAESRSRPSRWRPARPTFTQVVLAAAEERFRDDPLLRVTSDQVATLLVLLHRRGQDPSIVAATYDVLRGGMSSADAETRIRLLRDAGSGASDARSAPGAARIAA